MAAEVAAVAVVAVEAPSLAADLPVDPLGQDWERVVELILADGPPDEFPADLGHGGPLAVLEVLAVLAAAAAPEKDADLDGAAVAVALAGAELGSLPDDGVVAAVAAASRLAAWAAGVELAATAELTRRAQGWRGVGVNGGAPELLSARDLAAAEVAAACSVSHQGAVFRVDLAADLVRLPGTRLALAGGRLDRAKVLAIADAVAVLDDDAAAAVESRVLPRAAGQTMPALRAALRRAVIAADPAAAENRRVAQVAARRVLRYPGEDGTATVAWTGPVHEVDGFWLWLTGCATAARGPAAVDDRTLDQRRSDVLGDIGARGLAQSLTDCGAELPKVKGRRAQIGVVVAASTLLGLDEEPGELLGAGPITAPLARRIAAEGTWRRLLVDPRTGRLDEVSVDSYHPPQDMVEHVIARDGTCRGIGCRVPARHSDLDHIRPWPAGPTETANLHPAHRLHHRIKTLTDTTVHVDPDGTTVWTLPSGRSYRVPPHQVIDHPNLDPPALRHGMDDLRDATRQMRQMRPSHQDRGDADPGPPAGRRHVADPDPPIDQQSTDQLDLPPF